MERLLLPEELILPMKYMNLKERFGYWKDTAVMIEGEAAKSFTDYYFANVECR